MFFFFLFFVFFYPVIWWIQMNIKITMSRYTLPPSEMCLCQMELKLLRMQIAYMLSGRCWDSWTKDLICFVEAMAISCPTMPASVRHAELVMGWVHSWVGLGWVGLGWVETWLRDTLLSVSEYCSWIITVIDSWLVGCRVNKQTQLNYWSGGWMRDSSDFHSSCQLWTCLWRVTVVAWSFRYNLICHTKCRWWVV